MKNLALLSVTVLAATSGLIFGTMQAASALNWNWNYSGTGITASGTFTTNDTPDDLGFYQISEITGTRNVKKNAERRTAAREYPHGWNPGDLRMEKFSFSLAFKFGGSHTNTQKPELLTHNEKTRFIF